MDRLKDKQIVNNIFKSEIQIEIKKIIEGTLDFAEVAIGDSSRFKIFRARVLKFCNDANRALGEKLDEDYLVIKNGYGTDIIEFKGTKKIGGKNE